MQSERKKFSEELNIDISHPEAGFTEADKIKTERYITLLFLIYSYHSDKPKLFYQIANESGLIRESFAEVYNMFKNPETLIDYVKINRLLPNILTWYANCIDDKDRDIRFNKLGLLSKQQFFNLMSQMIHHPELTAIFVPVFGRLQGVYFGSDGYCFDRWSRLGDAILKKSEIYKLHPQLFLKPGKVNSTPISDYKLDEAKIINKILGRTILFESKDDTLLAVKIQKKTESVNELTKEYNTSLYLKKHSEIMGLKSFIHDAKAVIKISNTREFLQSNLINEVELKKLENLVNLDGENSAYIYSVPMNRKGCFTYLHEPIISDQGFSNANRIVVNDIIRLIQHGFYFSHLADIFHTGKEVSEEREDKGRYRTLVNVINQYFYGKGRLNDWLGSIEYVNARLEGLVDLGDWMPVADLFNNDSDFVRDYYSQPHHSLFGVSWCRPDEKVGNTALVNSIAECLFVLELCAGRRGRFFTQQANEKKVEDKEIKKIWYKLANQLLENGVQAIAEFCHIPEYRAHELLNPWINLDHYAEQMWFWMTNKYINIINDHTVKSVILPESLYGKDVNAESEIDRYRDNSFNKDIGCSANGKDQDLGPVNGQYPIKEGDKLAYIVACIIHTVENQTYIDEEHLRNEIKLLKEKKYKEAQAACEGIVGLNKQNPKLNLKALLETESSLKEIKSSSETKEPSEVEFQLIKQKQFHSNQIAKFYGSRWLGLYRANKLNPIVKSELKTDFQSAKIIASPKC